MCCKGCVWYDYNRQEVLEAIWHWLLLLLQLDACDQQLLRVGRHAAVTADNCMCPTVLRVCCVTARQAGRLVGVPRGVS